MAKKTTEQQISAEAEARGLNKPGRFDERQAYIAQRNREIEVESRTALLRHLAEHGPLI